jgi:DNA-binding NarL/FixJ family response regulator
MPKKRIQDSHLDAKKILITAYRSEEVISEAINIGVKEIIEKSLSRLIEAR